MFTYVCLYMCMCNIFTHVCIYIQASLVAQSVKNLPAIWETWVQSLGWEDPTCCGATKLMHHNY